MRAVFQGEREKEEKVRQEEKPGSDYEGGDTTKKGQDLKDGDKKTTPCTGDHKASDHGHDYQDDGGKNPSGSPGAAKAKLNKWPGSGLFSCLVLDPVKQAFIHFHRVFFP